MECIGVTPRGNLESEVNHGVIVIKGIIEKLKFKDAIQQM